MPELLNTTDPFAQELLEPRNLAVAGDNDKHYIRLANLSKKVVAAKAQLPPKYAEIGELLLNGTTKADIISELGTSYPTINKVAADPDVNDYLALVCQMRQLRGGPSLEQRKAMLWRIATDNEEEHPRTSILALDALNKQDGGLPEG